MLFSQAHTLILVTRQQLALIQKSEVKGTLKFGAEFTHLEVRDVQLLEKNIVDLLTKVERLGNTLIVLAPDMSFSVQLEKSEEYEAKKQVWLELVPLPVPDQSVLEIESKSRCTLLVTNQKLLQTLSKAVVASHGIVSGLTPAVAWGKTNWPLSMEEYVDMMKDSRTYSKHSYEASEQKLSSSAAEESSLSSSEGEASDIEHRFSRRVIGLGVLFIVLLVVLGGLVWRQSMSPESVEEIPTELVPLISTQAETGIVMDTPASGSSSLARSEVQIRILNGSGVAGQAGRLQGPLIEAGYTNTITGNATQSGQTTTLLRYSDTLNPELITEIELILKPLVASIRSQVVLDLEVGQVEIVSGI